MGAGFRSAESVRRDQATRSPQIRLATSDPPETNEALRAGERPGRSPDFWLFSARADGLLQHSGTPDRQAEQPPCALSNRGACVQLFGGGSRWQTHRAADARVFGYAPRPSIGP